jgi:hypothetical protein
VLMVIMGSAIGGTTGMVFAFIMAAGMYFFSYWYSDTIHPENVCRPGNRRVRPPGIQWHNPSPGP